MASDFLKKMAAQAAQNVDRQYGTGEKVYGSSQFLKNMAAKSQAAQKPPVSSLPKLDPAQQTKLQLATLGMQQPTQNDINSLYQKRNELKALQLNPYNDQNIGNVASEITSIDKQIESLGKIVPGAQLKQSGIRAYTEPLAAGVQDFTSGIYSALEAGANALDSVIPENILSKGIHKLYKADQAGQQTTEQKLQEAQVGRGDAFKAYQTLGQGVGQAAPNAVLALATGGASVATQLPEIAGSAGLTTAVRSSLTTIGKNPLFKLSFVQNYGNAYSNAKNSGATEDEAQLTAIIIGLVNSGIELTGGLETLPAALKSGNASTIKKWVTSALSEGKEEVVQGVIERLTNKMVYDKDAPLASLTDPNAVFNPVTAAKEYGGGVTIGGILGGGQVLGNNIINATQKPRPMPPPEQITNETGNFDDAPTTPQNAPQAILNQPASTVAPQLSNAPQANVEAQDGIATNNASELPEGMGAMSTAFPYVERVSEFYKNTISNSDILTQAQKDMFDEKDYTFKSVPEEESVAESSQRLQIDFAGEVADLKQSEFKSASDTDTAMGILASYAAEGMETGDYSKMLDWGINIYTKTHENAVALQALDKYSRTPEDSVRKGIQIIENMAKQKTTTKELGKDIQNSTGRKIKEETDAIVKDADSATDEAAKQTKEEMTAEEKLANRIANTTKDPRSRQPDAINDMVNELFKSAKESPLPERAESIRRSPIEFLQQAIQNKAQYADVWEKAKALLMQKYADNAEVLSMLNDYFNKGIVPTYSQATLNASLNQALKDLDLKLVELAKAYPKDKQTALKKLTEYIIQRTGATAEDATMLAQQIQARFDTLVAEKSAQILKQKLKTTTRKADKTMLEKIIELANLGAFNNESVASLVREKYGIPALNKTDIQKIYEFSQLASQQTDDYMKRLYESKAARVIGDKLPSTIKDKVLTIRRIAMLLNPKTLLTRNAGGNLIFAATENVKDVPGNVIDFFVGKATGVRTTTALSVGKYAGQAQGFGKGAAELFKDIKYGVDTSPTRHEMTPTTTLKSKVGGFIETVLNKMLQAGDRPFYEAAYKGRINELKTLGRDITNADTIAEAQLFALERVFQNDSKYAQAAYKIREALNTFGLLGDITIPFAQTPSNIFDKLMDYSPWGFVRAIKKAGTIKDSAWRQKQFVDTLARSLTGTGIIFLAYGLAKAGLLFGGNTDDDEKMFGAEAKRGVQKYSINVGDGTYTYDWASPIGVLLAIGADMYQMGVGKADFLSFAMSAIEATGSVMFQQSYLEGLSDLFNSNTAQGENAFVKGVENMILNLPASFIPTGFAQIARSIDNTQRETYDTRAWKRMLNKVMAKIPGLSTSLEPKIGTDGQPLTYSQGRPTGLRIFEQVLSPGFLKQNTQNDVDKELQRLYEATGEKAVLPKYNQYLTGGDLNITYKNTAYTMTTQEFTKFQTTLGEKTYDLIGQFISGKEYAELSNADKAKYSADLINFAADQAKKQFLESRGVTYETSYKDLTAALGARITPAQYYTAHDIYKSLEENKSISAQDKANLFASKVEKALPYLDANKIAVLEKQLSYSTIMPQSADRYNNMTAAGMNQNDAIMAYNTLSEFEAGAKDYEKYLSIGQMKLSDSDKLKVIKEYFKPNPNNTTYSQFATAQSYGIGISDYADFKSRAYQIGGGKTLSQPELLQVLDGMKLPNEDKGVIYAMYSKTWKSGNKYLPGVYHNSLTWAT
jgi:hypothetical protein